MNPSDILERAEDWNQRGDHLRLRPLEWVLLFAIDGVSAVGDLVRRAEVEESVVLSTLLKFLQLGLIRRAELTWSEFCERCPGLLTSAARGGAAPIARVESTPSAAAAASPPTAPEPAAAPVRFRLTGSPQRAAKGQAAEPVMEATSRPSDVAVRTTPLPRPPAATAVRVAAPAQRAPVSPAAPGSASSQPLSLRSILDFIMGHAGGGNRGQLAVYRTFLKVPTSQLHQAGIKSLDLATSEVQITDPVLQTSILNAVETVLGRPYSVPSA